ncbi:MAG: hypothetical protein B7Z58_00550 [Acidiphilium sp. 37-64-53]|uniref:DUF6691 family protein n=1 Tax=Acidiphilium TaxID=522 RepID=UPI000BD68960|nr:MULTISPECIES: DUF6691 family protein [Acidiphilium]OYW04098.1 MAG: hypothetical protein B7Z58_00550 [Acidiphilium sp. 37-64-53]OZB31033.1 MAG: hypothetical protein B7X49_00090 [Acidiphilium sp. 34-64-41]HQT83336.1 YeeE/YedE family protein [Acidiphilium rubrum]
MRRTLVAFLAGLIFGAGLLVSRMADPAKVLNFLDLTAHWDPSLAFVMAGGVVVASLAFAVARRRSHPWFGTQFPTLPYGGITARLVIGAGLFGIGWGLVGLCPGPALVALAIHPLRVAPFVIAMIAGLWIVRLLSARRVQSAAAARSESLVQNSR